MSNNFDIFPNQKKKKQATYLFCVFFFLGGFRLFFPFECQKAEIQEVIQNNINVLQKNIKTELIFFCCILLFRFGENEKEQHLEQYQNKLILFFCIVLFADFRAKHSAKRCKYEFSPHAKVKITKNMIRFLVVMPAKTSAAPTEIEAVVYY